MGTAAPRPNKSPRRKPGDREPPDADPVAYASGFYGTAAPRPIKAPGVSRGIANRSGQIPSLTLGAFMGRETGAARQRDYVRATNT